MARSISEKGKRKVRAMTAAVRKKYATKKKKTPGLGSGMAQRAKKTIKGAKARRDKAIRDAGG